MNKPVCNKKRKYVRIPLETAVRYTTDKFNWHLSRSQNISKTGIFIGTERDFKAGSRIYLILTLSKGQQAKKIKAVGEVVRSANIEEEVDKKKGNGIGIKFSLLPSEEQMIQGLIRSGAHRSQVVSFSSLLP